MNESLMGSFVPDCWMLKHSLFCYRLYNLSWHSCSHPYASIFGFWLVSSIMSWLQSLTVCSAPLIRMVTGVCSRILSCVCTVYDWKRFSFHDSSQLPVMLVHLQLCPAFTVLYFHFPKCIPKVFQTTIQNKVPEVVYVTV